MYDVCDFFIEYKRGPKKNSNIRWDATQTYNTRHYPDGAWDCEARIELRPATPAQEEQTSLHESSSATATALLLGNLRPIATSGLTAAASPAAPLEDAACDA